MNKKYYRIFFFLSFAFFSHFLVYAQASPYKYFTRDGANVWFEAIYQVDTIPKDSLMMALIQFIPTIKGVSDVHQNSEGLTAAIKDYNFDYKAAGYSVWSCPSALGHPMAANLTIAVKDGKYRVVISNIIMNDDERLKRDAPIFYRAELNVIISKLSKSEFATAKDKIKMFTNLENEWYQNFKLRGNKKSDW